jgi:L-aspartate oxidase
VLILGAGIAGLITALELRERHPDRSIALVAKGSLGDGNTRLAQGGIAVVAGETDSSDAHLTDTLEAGAGLCHEPAVRAIIERAPAALAKLRARGIRFDTAAEGGPELALEGGHTHRRIHHRGDRSGAAIVEGLLAAVRSDPSIRVLEHSTAVDLHVGTHRYRTGESGEVLGAYLLDEDSSRIHVVEAALTVLATGGSGKVFRYTSNAEAATGDGIAMAYRAGARVANLEFFQFHPTLLYHSGMHNLLLTEALRGEGAYLLIPGTDDRFMLRVDPDRGELATRDVVARAIFTEMEKHDLEYVHLDVRHLDPEVIARKFPGILSTLERLRIDPRTEPVPVVPAAHYQCGGVLAQIDGTTDLDRLLAIGEVACTGLHGANRLASNSLMEGMVMGCAAAEAADRWLASPAQPEREILDWDSKSVSNPRRASQINAHWRGLRGEMSSYAGIVRTEAGLQDLQRLIRLRREIIEEYYWRHTVTTDLLELRNIALLAELLTESALHRRESIGGHYREDFPGREPLSSDTVLRLQRIYPSTSSRFERPLA